MKHSLIFLLLPFILYPIAFRSWIDLGGVNLTNRWI